MKQVVIADYVRTAFTPAKRGALATARPDDLAADVIKALVARSGVDANDIEDVIMGCAFPEAEQGLNIARMAGLLAGVPVSSAATTVNRFCGSSMQAIHMAAGAIQMNAGEAFICAGIESMSKVPMTGFNPMPNPTLMDGPLNAYISMGETAENLARKYDIARSDQENMAVGSHAKANQAQAAGRFTDEIVATSAAGQAVDQDGCIRPDTNAQSLAGLDPAFAADGSVTAGTSSPLTDGAAAVLVVSEDYADAHGLKKLARIRGIAVAGCSPDIMGIGPVPATEKALKRAGITVSDLDVIELNEAFAAQALACIREACLPEDKINLDGGAIALGHPLGATGARITGKASALLHRENKTLALATQCIGGGQGIATVLEACA